MTNSHSSALQVRWKIILTVSILALSANLLGLINLSTVYGFKIHFFQYAVFLAASFSGPAGGALTGGFGSLYSALSMHNPYIIGGNIILGFITGLCLKKNLHVVPAVLLAFIVQLPWLYLTDVYLIQKPPGAVLRLILSLLFSNLLWAILAGYTSKFINQRTK